MYPQRYNITPCVCVYYLGQNGISCCGNLTTEATDNKIPQPCSSQGFIIKGKKDKTLEGKYDQDNAIGKYLYNKNRKHIRALPRAVEALKPDFRHITENLILVL